jgi:hypothetical protein
MPIGTPDEILSFIEGPGVTSESHRVLSDLKKWFRFREKRNVRWIGTA